MCSAFIISRYDKEINFAANEAIKAGRGQGIGMGFFFGVIFGAYALAYWCVFYCTQSTSLCIN